MSIKKDILLKEIDFINEDIRFWHNLILALLSGLSGLAYLYTQNRLIINNFSLSLISGGIISLIVILIIISYNHNKRVKILKRLEKIV